MIVYKQKRGMCKFSIKAYIPLVYPLCYNMTNHYWFNLLKFAIVLSLCVKTALFDCWMQVLALVVLLHIARLILTMPWLQRTKLSVQEQQHTLSASDSEIMVAVSRMVFTQEGSCEAHYTVKDTEESERCSGRSLLVV